MTCCARRVRCGLLTVVMGAVGASAVAAQDCPAGTQTIQIVLTPGMLDGSEKIPNDVVQVRTGSPLLWSVANKSGQRVKASFINFHKDGDPQKKEDAIKFHGWPRGKNSVKVEDSQTGDLCVKVKAKSQPYTHLVKYDIELEFEDNNGKDTEILHDPRLDFRDPGPLKKDLKKEGGARP